MKGCFYNLSSNIWKNEFALHTRMLCAVAFMPPDNVIAGFKELSDLIRDTYQGIMDDLLNYFEETYIGWYRRNAEHQPPLFALNLWNMFHRTFDELLRTNNHGKGWQQHFQVQVSLCHPIFWKCINLLRTEEIIIRVKIIQNLPGATTRVGFLPQVRLGTTSYTE